MITATAVFAWQWCEKEKKIVSRSANVRAIKAQSTLLAFLTFMPMFLVNALMKYVGNDYGNYYIYFQRIVSGKEQDVDIAYKLICIFVAKMGLEFQWVYVIICLISYVLLLACIYKYSDNYAVSYLMFFFNGYFALLGLNQIRQFVSVVLVLYAYDFIRRKKFVQYCVGVVIAASFHFTAIIMIPFYWILQKKWKLSVYGIVALVLLPFNLFYTQVMTWLFATFLPRYLNTNYTTREFSIDIPYLCVIIVTFIICLLYKQNEEKTIFHNCMMISATLALFGSWLPEYGRFIYYFFIVSIVYVTELVEKERDRKRKICIYITLLSVYAWYFFRAMINWGIYPYKSVFT